MSSIQSQETTKIKHDWYQTDTHVFINVLAKNIKKDDVLMTFSETKLDLKAKLPSGEDFGIGLSLSYPIRPDECSFKVLASKIEIKMKKFDGIRWLILEGDGIPPAIKVINTVNTVTETAALERPIQYPSSALKRKDWDKLEAQLSKEEEEKLEGDAALNQLFQKIYCQGSEEVKRAMNKSFSESGGTVLSTNWNEVAVKKQDVKAPDGMEWKNWDK